MLLFHQGILFSTLLFLDTKMKKFILSVTLFLGVALRIIQASLAGQSWLDQQAKALEPRLIEWRRHFHQSPELPNRESKGGARIAEELLGLGLGVQYPVARTGIVMIFKGASSPSWL